jgi:hypothetical protein
MKKSDDDEMSQAFQKIHKLFGAGTSIGRDAQKQDGTYFIKVRQEGLLLKVGYGKTWDEAIANVTEVKRSSQ